MAILKTEQSVLISVGSNLGDKLAACGDGIVRMNAADHTRLRAVSRFYRTAPVDDVDQDWFVNAVVQIGTRLNPLALLDLLMEIERRLGRKRDSRRYGPRTLDLDILLFGDRVVQTDRLQIPHPRMHKRAFVLQPICDINPATRHPVLGRSVSELLKVLDDPAQQIIPLAHPPRSIQGLLP